MKTIVKFICIWFAVLFMLCLYIQCAHSQEVDKPIDYSWSGTQLNKEVIFVALMFEDYTQTKEIKEKPGIQETNPILGKHPSDSKIKNYFITTIITEVLVVHNIPSYRDTLLDVGIVFEGGVTMHNAKIGLTWKF